MSTDEALATTGQRWRAWLGIALSVYGILLAVGMVGAGFKWFAGGAEGARELFAFASNPFVGLMVGMLATVLVQSSSTVTSVIVGLVAGGLPVSEAIPMIMGANVGTTITNTLVAMGHVRKKKEFRKAFAAATVHDFFNVMAVAVFLPLELAFGILEKLSFWVSGFFAGTEASINIKDLNFIKPLTKPVIGAEKDLLLSMGLPDKVAAVVLALLGVALIFASIMLIGRLLKVVMVGRAKHALHSAVGRGPMTGIASGATVTVLVQSSSTTTSLIVPLAGTGVFSLREIYPFTLGANIGTTITALLASLAITNEFAQFAMQIALVHFFYNVLAVSVLFSLPVVRDWPIRGAEWLSEISAEKKLYGLSYVFGVFFLLPALLIAVTSQL
ncbi:NptA protein [gamma proteobacterium HTCC5015]|nr:NptA protein [gamma proteobacterium HTCC5015]